MNKLTVSIVTFNSQRYILDCIKSLLNNKELDGSNIIVVDNNSEDETTKIIEKHFPKIKIIKNKVNLGFAKAHNQVLGSVKTPYTLLINPDTTVEKNTLDKMTLFMDENPECGVASCKELDFKGLLQPNAGQIPRGLPLLSWIFNLETLGIKSNYHRTDEDYYRQVTEVGWVSGSFFFIRSEVLTKITPFGGLNADYFMYFEDTEFCYKVRKAGYKVMLNPDVSVKHVSGGSSDDPKLRQWSGEIKGMIFFYSEEFGLTEAAILRIFIYLGLLARVIAYSLIGNLKFARTYGKIIATGF